MPKWADHYFVSQRWPRLFGQGSEVDKFGRHDVPAFAGLGSEHVANADVELRGGIACYRNTQAGTAVVA